MQIYKNITYALNPLPCLMYYREDERPRAKSRLPPGYPAFKHPPAY